MTLAELPYRGVATLVLDYSDGGELTFTSIELLVCRTSSAGILDVAGSGLEYALEQPGLERARVVLPSGTVIVGEVTYVNQVGRRFVLSVNGPPLNV